MSYYELEDFIRNKQNNKQNTINQPTVSSSNIKVDKQARNIPVSQGTRIPPDNSRNKKTASGNNLSKVMYSGVHRTSNSRQKQAPTRGRLKNKNKSFKKTLQKVLLSTLILSAIATSVVINMDGSDVNNTPTVPSTETMVRYEGIKLDNLSYEQGKIDKAEVQLTEEDLLNYKNYSYYDNYNDKTYLFCPEEYVLKLAEFAINKLEKQYAQSGKMNELKGGEGYIPNIISPELIASICMMESSYRIEDENGLPLGADRKYDKSIRAEGILQQKPAFVTDANNYSLMYGGKGYTNNDRYNPLTAMEMCVGNLNRIYRSYLVPGRDTFNALCRNGASDVNILGALIIAYNQGEGSIMKWAKSGVFEEVINNPNCTNKYGAEYLRTVLGYLEDIQERNSDEMEIN